jgi:hypothetical protein
MVNSPEVTGATVVIRPPRKKGLVWMMVITTLICWMFWALSSYDTGPWTLLYLSIPVILLLGVVARRIQERTSFVKIDRDQDEVLCERRPFLVLPPRQRRYALSDFVGVGSSPQRAGEWVECVVVLLTADMRSLELFRTDHEYVSRSFWSLTAKSVEPKEATAVRNDVARISGLRNMGFIDDLGFFNRRYSPLED